MTEVNTMQLPLQVSFRHMSHSPAIEKLVQAKAAKLDTFSDQIVSCRVVVEPVGKHRQHGNLYEVRIDLTVPDEEIVVTREPSQHAEYRDIHVSLRDAFDTARRKLEDYVRRRRGFVKTLESVPHARVSKLFADEGYGFLETPENREIYFHRDSVLNGGFARLELGTEVTFVEAEGAKGPQASTVKPVGRHHHM
jgi:cold shock CspA family protein/ribosome-associated translation inhibitor RaiA